MPTDTPTLVTAILRQRADEQLHRSVLYVDYYRIRRKLAFELPIRELPTVDMTPKGIPAYPWGTWLLWAWEERLSVLGWAAQHDHNARATELFNEEISALAQWPRYEQYEAPDLVMGHLVRTLAVAARRPILRPEVREQITQACQKIITNFLHISETRYGSFTTVAQVIEAADKELGVLANIPLIGQLALCMAARLCRHEVTEKLNRRVALLYQAVLERHKTGTCEGVIYDGYVLDFIADWLTDVDDAASLTHAWDKHTLAELARPPFELTAPGNALELAPIGDVEPREMPFYLSADLKFTCLKHVVLTNDLTRDPYFREFDWHVVRSDGLEVIAAPANPLRFEPVTPSAAPLIRQSPYTVALRSSSFDNALSVCLGFPQSRFGHLHSDTGSLVIGASGHWLITDPGYQQYLNTSERHFTLGPQAHNAPVINGHHQSLRLGKLLALTPAPTQSGQPMKAQLDMTSCYASEAQVSRAVRTVWLHTSQSPDLGVVIVRDEIQTTNPHDIAYTWHGDARASWLLNTPVPAIVVPHINTSQGDDKLWIQARNIEVSACNIDRLRGSRGSLSLTAKTHAEQNHATYWWIFTRSNKPAEIVATSPTEMKLRVDQITLEFRD